jgi:hypothetical protein
MRITLFLGALLVCLLLAAEPAPADATQKRVLSGRTAEGQRITLALSGGTLRVLRFRARLRCRNREILVVDESGFLPTHVRGGRFSDVQFGSTDEVRFRGRMIGTSVRGRLHVKDQLPKRPVPCASGWIGFSAQA